MEEQRSIVIIGGGISGLSLGAYIKDGGFNSIVVEKDARVGGKLFTEYKDGYTLDVGANTTATNVALEEMIKILGIEDQVIRPSKASQRRYVVKNSKLKEVSSNPKDLLFSNVLSLSAKMSVFQERFKKPNEYKEDESVGDFFERRFGKEVVDQLVDPFISGIYAGDPYKLSIKSVFPKLLDLEARYGSVTKALQAEQGNMPKREIIAFKGGMKTLVDGFVSYIGEENVLCDMNVQSVKQLGNGKFAIDLLQDGMSLEILADVVVFATPSNVTANFLKHISPELSSLLEMEYPQMLVLNLGFRKSAFKKPFSGFGFLVPKVENKSFLGATANSAFLPDRAPEDHELFTLYIGGANQSGNLDDLVEPAITEFMQIMKLNERPIFQNTHFWEHAIPQLTVGHFKRTEGIEFFERNTHNIHILGNYVCGLGVGECVSGAKRTHGQLIKDYSKQSYMAAKDEDIKQKKKK